MDTLNRVWQDVRYATRSLRRTPSVTLAAIVTLALGIGATTTVYSVFEAVLLRRLLVSSPDRLFFVAHGLEGVSTSSTYPWFERVTQQASVFDAVTAYNIRDFKVSSGDGVDVVPGQFVNGNYHDALGVPMQLGRGFTGESDRTPSPVAVISDRYWVRRFGRQPDVLGKSIVVGTQVVTIVGVTAAGFDGMTPGRATKSTSTRHSALSRRSTCSTWHCLRIASSAAVGAGNASPLRCCRRRSAPIVCARNTGARSKS